MFNGIFVELLQEKGITAYKVAKDTGISQGLMNEYKNGKRTPTTENLIKIADYLKCSIDYLLGRIGTDEREIQLIGNFRKLTDEGKKAVLNYSEFATTNPEYQKYTDIPKEA